MKYIDTAGNVFDHENNEYLVEQIISPSLTVIYQKIDSDIELFLRAMNNDIESSLLETEKAEFLAGRCTKRNGRCQGSCTKGSCRSFSSGNFSGCKCY